MSEDETQARRQWAEADQWFGKADEDIRMADLALAADPPLIDPAAFHCQQAAEKIVEGLLVAAAVQAPRTHDLEALAALAGPLYPELSSTMDSIAPVSAWLARTRYPGLTDGVGAAMSEVAEMLMSIKSFRQAAPARISAPSR